jgi:hypothetical protein
MSFILVATIVAYDKEVPQEALNLFPREGGVFPLTRSTIRLYASGFASRLTQQSLHVATSLAGETIVKCDGL